MLKKTLIKVACLAMGMSLLTGCTWLQVFSTAAEVIEHYPSDNVIEEIGEGYVEEYFDLGPGSFDVSVLSPEEE